MSFPDRGECVVIPTQDVPAIVETEHLTRHFVVGQGLFGRGQCLHAVEDVSLRIAPGETLGLVGESGCGKSTLGRTLLRLIEPTSGTIRVDGRDITTLPPKVLRPLRRRMQIIFQDPFSSLDPRMTIRETLIEPMRIHRLYASREEERQALLGLLDRVGLKEEALDRYPHEFSGGQRQRIGVARALTVEPGFIVCDEPLSALDVSIQAQIINLLLELRDTLNVSYLFISHDLEVVRFISHRIAVMYLGRIVEVGPAEQVASLRLHPYTKALLGAAPIAEPGAAPKRRVLLEGDVPSPLAPPQGCAFHPRCSRAVRGKCDQAIPQLVELSSQSAHQVACYFPGN
jgi:oligopeptide transport system ATP-binding protein